MTLGQRGEAVRDLQRRLTSAGAIDERLTPGVYCESTARAVKQFQNERGLRTTGVCDDATWTALIEAGFGLGSRLLMMAAPHQRGDDVVALQSGLAKLGFDPGRVDGILGPDTTRALRDFQSNSGLVVDGVCGPRTISTLELLARQSGDGPGVAAIKELESIRAGARMFSDLRIVVGQFGGISSVARQLLQALRQRSATAIASDEPDAQAQAAIANRFHATVYVGFDANDDHTSAVEYYASSQFESAGGKSLAGLIAPGLNDIPSSPQTFAPVGMQIPILRATRMSAVLISTGDIQSLHDHSEDVVRVIVDALHAWVQNPGLSTD